MRIIDLKVPFSTKEMLVRYEQLQRAHEELKKMKEMVKFFEGSQWPEKLQEYQTRLSLAEKNFKTTKDNFYKKAK